MDLFDFSVKIKEYINKDLGEVTYWGYGIDAEDPYKQSDVNTRYMTVKDYQGVLHRIIIQKI
jgi:hypothetical protein